MGDYSDVPVIRLQNSAIFTAASIDIKNLDLL